MGKSLIWKPSFYNSFLEIFPDSVNTLIFPKYNETITWNKCTMCIHNVLSTERWIDHYGDVLVQSSFGNKAQISFIQVRSFIFEHHAYENNFLSRVIIVHV